MAHRAAPGHTACATSLSSPACRPRPSTGCCTDAQERAPGPSGRSSRRCSTSTGSRPSSASPRAPSCSTSSCRPRPASARLSGRRSKPSCPARDRRRPGRFHLRESAIARRCRPRRHRHSRTHLPRGPAQGAGPSRGGGRVAAAAGAGVPVVTLVTDVRDSGRIAYVGLDNAAAGSTAAYRLAVARGPGGGGAADSEPLQLLRRVGAGGRLHAGPGATRPRAAGGHRERLRRSRRDHGCVGRGGARGLSGAVRGLLVGGGNRHVSGLRAARRCRPFVGHDLDDDNLDLLRTGP